MRRSSPLIVFVVARAGGKTKRNSKETAEFNMHAGQHLLAGRVFQDAVHQHARAARAAQLRLRPRRWKHLELRKLHAVGAPVVVVGDERARALVKRQRLAALRHVAHPALQASVTVAREAEQLAIAARPVVAVVVRELRARGRDAEGEQCRRGRRHAEHPGVRCALARRSQQNKHTKRKKKTARRRRRRRRRKTKEEEGAGEVEGVHGAGGAAAADHARPS
mgnify:CR=1 FL=1